MSEEDDMLEEKENEEDYFFDEKEEKSEAQKIPLQYTNHIGIEASPYDIKLMLGVKSADQEPQISNAIVMSPQHAKSLYETLGRVLTEYEKNVGEIPGTEQEETGEESQG